MIKNILFIHQSSELYGSDKTLLYLVLGIHKTKNFNAIVVLPGEGPLKSLLEDHDIRVIVHPIVKASRNMFRIGNVLSMPIQFFCESKKLRKHLKGTEIDLVHSNTLAVLLGAFFSRRYGIKHLWHVHEIIEKPRIVSNFFPFIVNKFSDFIVFNSEATKSSMVKKETGIYKKSAIILNGLDRDSNALTLFKINETRNELFKARQNEIVIALVGRINRWKGHLLMLEAFHYLLKDFTNIKLVFVGSPPTGQEHFLREVESRIQELNIEEHCKIIAFQENIWNIWDSIDIAVVPSTEPEPFGLVAIEAMLAKKPVIASNQGGLLEIVREGKSGYFFEANNKLDLAKKITTFINNPEKIREMGNNGYDIVLKEFSLHHYIDKFIELYSEQVG